MWATLERSEKTRLTIWLCRDISHALAHFVYYSTAAAHILQDVWDSCVQKQDHARGNNAKSMMTAAIFDNLVICDIFLGRTYPVIVIILQSTKHKSHTHTQQTREEANCLIWSFPDSSFSLNGGRRAFFSPLPHPAVSVTLSWSLPSPHMSGPLLNYPGMPHISLYSSH